MYDRNREIRALTSEVKRIREARPLSEQRRIAASGQNPITGRWWPFWKEWKPTQTIRMIFSRFTSATGRLAGMKRSPAKTAAVRENARQPRPRARNRARQVSRALRSANGSVCSRDSQPGGRGAR